VSALHVQHDEGTLAVVHANRERLGLGIASPGNGDDDPSNVAGILLDRTEVEQVRDALTAWLER
jgi:hypothetical protein